MGKKAVLFLNGTPPPLALIEKHLKKVEYTLACDGAANWLKDLELVPSAIIGDFDSITDETKEFFSLVEMIEAPDQDKTDSQKALYFLKEQGFTKVTVLGAMGGSIDHQLHHLSLLADPDLMDVKIQLVSEKEVVFRGRKQMYLEGWIGRRISLLPLFGEVKSVTSKGLKWDLEDVTFKMGESLSISNKFAATEVVINSSDGFFLVILQPMVM
ncbi:MAG: thiamine diphosphokinase [SAR324 cluster bacterium]|nr:thiamine diphosphokinase [SAR324 cluster bacterium]